MAVSQVDIEVGKRLTELIDDLEGISSRQFAISIGIDPSQFAKIQKGTAAISLEKLVEISSTYNVSIEWLIFGRGEKLMDLIEVETWSREGGHPYEKKSGLWERPDHLLTLLKNEIPLIQARLDKLYQAALTTAGSSPVSSEPVQDLSLDKKSRKGPAGSNKDRRKSPSGNVSKKGN